MKVINTTLLKKFYNKLTTIFAKKTDIKSVNIINNLTTTTPGSALDASQGKALNDSITSLKKSVSDGKSAIASAITAKGVSTASDASFNTMANNIRNLKILTSSDRTFSNYPFEFFNHYKIYAVTSSTKTCWFVNSSTSSDLNNGEMHVETLMRYGAAYYAYWGGYIFFQYYNAKDGSGKFNLNVLDLTTNTSKYYSQVNSIQLDRRVWGDIVHFDSK